MCLGQFNPCGVDGRTGGTGNSLFGGAINKENAWNVFKKKKKKTTTESSRCVFWIRYCG